MIRTLALAIALLIATPVAASSAEASANSSGDEGEAASVPALSLSLYAPYAFQPGVRSGVDWTLGCGCVSEGRRRMQRGFFAGPRLAYTARAQNHRSLMLGAEYGWQSTNLRRGTTSQLSLGLNYLLSAQITTVTIDLGSGDATNTRELQHHVVPTIGYRFLDRIGQGPEWFLGGSYGRKFAIDRPNSAYFAFEVGMRFALGNRAHRGQEAGQ